MTITDDYFNIQEKYQNEYGEDTILLMQVGHFFECYAIDNEKEKINTHSFYKCADIMNVQVTRKSKKETENSRKNPLMTGINIYSKDKYLQILMDANFTVVLMEQVTEPPEPKREVTQIYSPGTNIVYSNKNTTSNTMCIYIEPDLSDSKRRFKNIGLSVIDFTTGKNGVYEVYSMKNTNDYYYSLDEALRFIQVYEPCETLIIVMDSNENCQSVKEISNGFIVNYLGLQNSRVHFKSRDEVADNYHLISFQNSFFNKIFKGKNTSMLSPIEFLDLERLDMARMSYIHLLNFAYAHNETIIQKIMIPEVFKSMRYMILNNNSISQLNLTPSNNQTVKTNNCLLGILTQTSTSMGKRFLREQLLNPVCDIAEISKRYDYTQSLINDNNYKSIEGLLNRIVDIERLHRRFSLGIIQPSEVYCLNYSYESVVKIIDEKREHFHNDILPSKENIQSFNEFIEEYKRIFKMDIIAKFNLDSIDENIFNKGINPEIDAVDENMINTRTKLEKICKQFSKTIGNELDSVFKLERNDRDGYFIVSTPTRAQNLKKKLYNYSNGYYTITTAIEPFKLNSGEIEFKRQASNKTIITSPEIKELCNEYLRSIYKIGSLCSKSFRESIETLEEKYSMVTNEIAKFVGTLDMYKSAAKVATQYGYHRPEIVPSNDLTSYIRAREIRHPIIERLDQSTIYVPNDISIGNNDEITQNGMLLYGTNASGKSSLMKAVGLNIIMAQAGFFVAASEFIYHPYQRLMTRILNADNIFRGESSFAVEMGELRGILKRADCNSLVLGDELCSGTENTSAQSIFASSVIHLNRRDCSFIFATHLHQLTSMPEILELERVKSFHLSVEYDDTTETLIYDRKLKVGNGPTIYGLEVCKAMDLDHDFIKTADSIRRNLSHIGTTILDYNKSRYNSKVIVDKCEICDESAEDTHHINFQCNANENGVIGGNIQKDTVANLVPLCKKCHNSVHTNDIIIKGYISTSNGTKLDYNIVSSEEKKAMNNSRKKFDEETVATILSVANSSKWKTQKLLQEYLEKEKNIIVSVSILRQIRAGKY